MANPAFIGADSLIATAGQTNVWRIKFPSRCVIKQLTIKQVAGSPGAFSAQLFSSKKPFDEYGSDSSGGSTAPGEEENPAFQMDSSMYHVGDTLDGDANGYLQRVWYDEGLAYANADGFSRERLIYLAITPGGSGDKTYDVSFTVVK